MKEQFNCDTQITCYLDNVVNIFNVICTSLLNISNTCT